MSEIFDDYFQPQQIFLTINNDFVCGLEVSFFV